MDDRQRRIFFAGMNNLLLVCELLAQSGGYRIWFAEYRGRPVYLVDKQDAHYAWRTR